MGEPDQTKEFRDISTNNSELEQKKGTKNRRGALQGIGPTVVRDIADLGNKPASVTNATANLCDSVTYNIVYNF
jgi:hypothetical protein